MNDEDIRGGFDTRARALTKRLLRAREQGPSADHVPHRAGSALRTAVALLATLAVVSVVTLAASHLRSSPSPSSGQQVHMPPAVTPVIKPILPAPTSAPSSSCAPGVPAADMAACVPPSSSIRFTSSQVGWLVGPRSVVATTDGGRHWSPQLHPGQHLIGADFIDAQHGWVVGAHNVFRTEDGGAHWRALSPTPYQLWSVHFVSPSQGWAIVGGEPSAYVAMNDGVNAPSTGAHLAFTGDGGDTWQDVDGPANAQSVCFIDQSNGWLGTTGSVYRSGDGGKHWQLAFAEPSPPGLQGASDLAFVECAYPASAWVLFLGSGAALSHAPYISFAAADGVHWRPVLEEPYTESGIRPQVHAPAGPGSYPGPFSVVSPSAAVYFAWSPPEGYGVSRMVVASRGGATLSDPVVVPHVNDVISAAFVSPTRGWAVGEVLSESSITLLVLATTDSGHTWSVQFSAPG